MSEKGLIEDIIDHIPNVVGTVEYRKKDAGGTIPLDVYDLLLGDKEALISSVFSGDPLPPLEPESANTLPMVKPLKTTISILKHSFSNSIVADELREGDQRTITITRAGFGTQFTITVLFGLHEKYPPNGVIIETDGFTLSIRDAEVFGEAVTLATTMYRQLYAGVEIS